MNIKNETKLGVPIEMHRLLLALRKLNKITSEKEGMEK